MSGLEEREMSEPLGAAVSEPVAQQRSVRDLMPEAWQSDGSAVWLAICRPFDLRPPLLAALKAGRSRVFEMGTVRGLLFFGTPPKGPTADELTVLPWDGGTVELRVEVSEPPEHAVRPAVWLLLLTAERQDGQPHPEGDARFRLDNAIALIRLLAGRNGAYDEPFPRIRLQKESASSPSPGILMPTSLGDANFDDDVFARLDAVGELLEKETLTAERMRLALRWSKQGDELSGVDSFLAWWIAVETIGMPDTMNIRPIVETLAEGYGLGYEQARSMFRIGRLADLRSQIVHQGRVHPMNQLLISYVHALFVDLVSNLTNKPMSALKSLLDADDFNLDRALGI